MIEFHWILVFYEGFTLRYSFLFQFISQFFFSYWKLIIISERGGRGRHASP